MTASIEAANGAYALAARGVWKRFGHVEALRDTSLGVRAGEVLALIGDNGAGKSTLTKILCGAMRPDRGEVVLAGRSRRLESVADAHALGIETVYQDLALAPDLSVLENMFLGRELLKGGWRRPLGVLARNRMRGDSETALDGLGIRLKSLEVPVRELSGGQRQALAVARAVMWAETAILLDEPTAALGTRQTALVYGIVRNVADRGLAVVVVSHDIPKMVEFADRIAIMRHGAVIGSVPAAETSVREVIDLMLGAGRAA